MAERSGTVISALMAFAGGIVAGMLLAPDSGSKTRERLSGEARAQLSRLDGQVEGLAKQLDGLQNQIHEASEAIASRVKDVAEKAIASVDDADEQTWEVHDDEVSRDLRRMPRK